MQSVCVCVCVGGGGGGGALTSLPSRASTMRLRSGGRAPAHIHKNMVITHTSHSLNYSSKLGTCKMRVIHGAG